MEAERVGTHRALGSKQLMGRLEAKPMRFKEPYVVSSSRQIDGPTHAWVAASSRAECRKRDTRHSQTLSLDSPKLSRSSALASS